MPEPFIATPDTPTPSGRVWSVFWVFLRLGLTSFGGPVAHLAYFRNEFVTRRRWLDDRSYSDLVALCQFLPGPASSKVGMALGMGHSGLRGAIAAWAGFTLPSALLMILFAYGVTEYRAIAESGWVQGLKVVAVAVVAQAVWGMSRSLCPDPPRMAFAVFAALLTLLLPATAGQLVAIVSCGLLGRAMLKIDAPPGQRAAVYGISRRGGVIALSLFILLLLGLPLWALASGSSLVAMLEGFYRSGALVFGGGHVLLPLLQAVVVPTGLVSNADFLAGYGAAQALPGPLFTFAAYLGTVADGPLQGWLGGIVLLVLVFLPGFLLLIGSLPFWEMLRRRRDIQNTLAGINAGVVGILLAALYDPLWTSAIHSISDLALALVAFGLLVAARMSPVIVVMMAAAAGAVLGA